MVGVQCEKHRPSFDTIAGGNSAPKERLLSQSCQCSCAVSDSADAAETLFGILEFKGKFAECDTFDAVKTFGSGIFIGKRTAVKIGETETGAVKHPCVTVGHIRICHDGHASAVNFIDDVGDISTAAVIGTNDLQVVFEFCREYTSLSGRAENRIRVAAFAQNCTCSIVDDVTVKSCAIGNHGQSALLSTEEVQSACFAFDCCGCFDTAAEKRNTIKVTGKL